MRLYVTRPRQECKNQFIVGANSEWLNFEGPKKTSTAAGLDVNKPDVSFECLNIGCLARKLKLGLTPPLQQIGVCETL